MPDAAPAARSVYRPRRPQSSPLFRTEVFRRVVLRLFVRLDLFDSDQAAGMLTSPHSGFHVHTAVWVPQDDRTFASRLARYCARNPVAVDRLPTAHEAGSRGGGHAVARLSAIVRSAISSNTQPTPIEIPTAAGSGSAGSPTRDDPRDRPPHSSDRPSTRDHSHGSRARTRSGPPLRGHGHSANRRHRRGS